MLIVLILTEFVYFSELIMHVFETIGNFFRKNANYLFDVLKRIFMKKQNKLVLYAIDAGVGDCILIHINNKVVCVSHMNPSGYDLIRVS